MTSSIGEPVGDIALEDDQGQTWTLAEHLGTPVLLIFHRHLM